MVNSVLAGALSLYSFVLFLPALCKPVAQAGAPDVFPDTASYTPIPADPNVPAGFQVGMSTQDDEGAPHAGPCQNNCNLPNPFDTTAGPPLPPGVYAAAVGPSLGGGSCASCGACYNLVQSGMPYCNVGDSSCAPTGPAEQDGLKSIKVVITNACTDCDSIPGHFDINLAPTGWNNPKIYYKQLDPSECL